MVLIAPNSKPPVARIMDFGKYRYEQQRKSREAKKNQTKVQLKEVRLSPVIDKHDFETKLRNGIKFLQKNNKLKVTLRFRGRQIAHADLGREVLNRFKEECLPYADVEKDVKLEGRSMTLVLAPKKDNK